METKLPRLLRAILYASLFMACTLFVFVALNYIFELVGFVGYAALMFIITFLSLIFIAYRTF